VIEIPQNNINRKLKIAHIAPVATTIPAEKSGSVELVAALLTEELVKRGHDVTLFATGTTKTSAKLFATFPQGYWENIDMWPWEHFELVHLAAACERADQFDVIQYQAAYYPMSLAFSRLIKTPMAHTLHHQPFPEQRDLWACYPEANLVAISNYQRNALVGLNCAAVIPHGIDLQNFAFSDKTEDYLVFFGRFTEGKGPLQAIEVAKRVGMRLLMAAPESGYYYDVVEPHVDGKQIVYLGELGHQEKVELLGGARAMIYPMQIGEPFGLVLIEAMACGTPVAALNKGAAPEIVVDGLSGYATDTLDELVAKLPDVMALPRKPIRLYAEDHYSIEAMTDGYEALYYRLVAEREAGESAPFNGGEIDQTEYAFSDLRPSR
jgi:glycosyltransferase involved in cell wall biosynthesis